MTKTVIIAAGVFTLFSCTKGEENRPKKKPLVKKKKLNKLRARVCELKGVVVHNGASFQSRRSALISYNNIVTILTQKKMALRVVTNKSNRPGCWLPVTWQGRTGFVFDAGLESAHKPEVPVKLRILKNELLTGRKYRKKKYKRYKTEAECLKYSKGLAWRKGRFLYLKTDTGENIVLANKSRDFLFRKEWKRLKIKIPFQKWLRTTKRVLALLNQKVEYYSFYTYFKKPKLYLISSSGYEWSGLLTYSRIMGKKIALKGFPHFAPDGRHLVVIRGARGGFNSEPFVYEIKHINNGTLTNITDGDLEDKLLDRSVYTFRESLQTQDSFEFYCWINKNAAVIKWDYLKKLIPNHPGYHVLEYLLLYKDSEIGKWRLY